MTKGKIGAAVGGGLLVVATGFGIGYATTSGNSGRQPVQVIAPSAATDSTTTTPVATTVPAEPTTTVAARATTVPPAPTTTTLPAATFPTAPATTVAPVTTTTAAPTPPTTLVACFVGSKATNTVPCA